MIETMNANADSARLLVDAYKVHQPFTPAPDSGPASPEEAYAVQRAVWLELAGDERPSAWKVTAPAPDATPIAGPVLPHRLARSPASFPAHTFVSPGIEVELAVCFEKDLPPRQPPYQRDEILDAISTVHVAMEIVDTRLADPQAAGPLWRLADNLVNGALVIGDAIPNWRRLDFATLVARAEINGRLIAESRGRPPLDDIFHCLPWWIAHVGGARAGDYVTTGAWNGMHPLTAPATVRTEFSGLGTATATVG
jgi:2-keto-4-pentenoate hydratase